MLLHSYRLISDNQITQNALIEAFCLHARNLIEFYKTQKYTENSYVPFYNKTTRIGSLNQRINNQISHLDLNQRTVDDAKKISHKEPSELLTILSEETVEFRKHLKPAYTGMTIIELMAQTPKGPAGSVPFPVVTSGVTGPSPSVEVVIRSNPKDA